METKNKSAKSANGFTLIEILTSIAIVAVISVIGFTYANNYKLTQYNVRRKADIVSLESTMKTYITAKKAYPYPAGNKQFYDKDGVYAHTSSGAYGVSGFITSEVFGKEFLSTTPLDPQSHNFYAFGRTQDTKNPKFEFATSFDHKGDYIAYSKGDYNGEDLAGLIREYNGPNFVINRGNSYLPYDPLEVKLVGKINSYSGNVLVNNSADNINKDLVEGDEIKVGIGGLATIYLSDGSQLMLGSKSKESILKMSELEYKEDNNLFTKVSITLSLGEIWVKAPDLEDGSELIVKTSNAAATVRGTVFGMSTDGTSGAQSIELIEGKLELNKADINGNIGDLLFISSVVSTDPSSQLRKIYEGTNYKVIMEAPVGKPIKLNYEIDTGATPINGSTGTISPVKIGEVMGGQIQLNESYIPKIEKIETNNIRNELKIELENKQANYIEGYSKNGKYISRLVDPNSDTITFTGELSSFTGELALRLCTLPTKNACKVNMKPISDLTTNLVSFDYNLIDKTYAEEFDNNTYLYQPQTLLFTPIKIETDINDFNFNLNINSNFNTLLSNTIFSNKSEDKLINRTAFDKVSLSSFSKLTDSEEGILKITEENEVFPGSTDSVTDGEVTINTQNTDGICTSNVVCSQFKNIEITSKDISVGPPECPENTLSNDCNDIGLIAYAPYDKPSDLTMYTGANVGIEPTSTGITSIEQCTPVFSGTTSAFSSGVCSGNETTLAGSGFLYNSGSSFFQLPYSDNTKGIFIDNSGSITKDKLQYDLSSLLSNNDDFAIEISVRGASLLRTGVYYLLSDSGLFNMYENNSNFRISSANSITSNSTNQYIKNINDFYKIIFEKKQNIGNLYLKDKYGTIIKLSAVGIPLQNIDFEHINIGTKKDFIIQWNDIIDYVKIFKY